MKKLLWIAAGLTLPMLASAEMYRWVDKNGAVHYTQTPPPGKAVERVRPAPPANPNSGALKSYSEANDKTAAERAKKEAEASAKFEKRTARCAEAQALMTKITTQPMNSLSEQDESGKFTRMTPERFEKIKAEAQAAIDKSCDAAP